MLSLTSPSSPELRDFCSNAAQMGTQGPHPWRVLNFQRLRHCWRASCPAAAAASQAASCSCDAPAHKRRKKWRIRGAVPMMCTWACLSWSNIAKTSAVLDNCRGRPETTKIIFPNLYVFLLKIAMIDHQKKLMQDDWWDQRVY